MFDYWIPIWIQVLLKIQKIK